MMRQWFYDRLKVVSTLPDPAIFAGGALTGSPSMDRFLVYRMQEISSVFNDGDQPDVGSQGVQVWVYDVGGSYDWIDSELDAIRDGLVGAAEVANGIACRWLGNSAELADDDMNRIVRNGQFQITGRI